MTGSRETPAISAAFLALVIMFCGATSVFAHALLDRASPTPGGTVQNPPPELKLWFTEAIEPAFSTVRVVDAIGKQVDKGDKAVDANDRALLTVSLPPLAPGTYKVIWRILSVDTHPTEGDFTFMVAP